MMRSWRPALPGCWPDEREGLLLGAIYWESEKARDAWEAWRRAVSSRDRITYSESRLLAAAFRPLRAIEVDDQMVSLAGGLYRRNWYENQLALHRLAKAVASLDAAGIQVLVLKGAALSLLHYRDLGARRMLDVDLLVSPRHLRAAMQVLAAGGWHPVATEGPVAGPLQYGRHLRDADGHELDLHAYAFMQSADDRDLWQSRVPLDLNGISTSAPGPAEQLLHVCVHGLRWDGATTRWAADAMAVLRSSQLDWDRLVERAQARRLSVTVGHALAWLRESLSAEIPAWVLQSLRAAPRLRFERALHEVYVRPPTRLAWALMSFDRYRRFALLAPPDDKPRSFVGFLESSWGIESHSRLLVHGVQKLIGRRR
jgi:putative nucleotidyltransferase-like protein